MARFALLGAALFAFLGAFASPAVAHSRGIQARGCEGCHGSSLSATLALSADRDVINPGDTVTFTATITRPGVKVGGIFVAEPAFGTLSTTSGDGLTLSAGALTHSSPRAASNDSVSFSFAWRAPSDRGAVELDIYALAANGDGNSTGDAPSEGVFPYVFGCTPATFYFDADGDGHGATDFPPTLGCADQPAPMGYAPNADDCDDGHDQVHPGAVERCNGKDDDCNGSIDDGASPEELFPDADGDGFYGADPGASVIGCLPLAGYADQPGDCAPNDATRYPGAKEVCNLFDDDCNGRVDEYVRPRCGVGLCEREGPSCNAADCVPGTPRAETCNLLDDDCNGEVDDGDLCGPGQACLGGECATLGDGGTGAGGAGGPTPAAGAAGTTPTGAAGSTSGAALGGGTATSPSNGTTGGAGPDDANHVASPQASSAGCAIARDDDHALVIWAFSLVLVTLGRRGARARRLTAQADQDDPIC